MFFLKFRDKHQSFDNNYILFDDKKSLDAATIINHADKGN